LRSWVVPCLVAIAVIIGSALIYGATIAPSPRDGLQPVEFTDQAFYAILGRDLAATGVESLLSPSGFDSVPGASAQHWYHWGEVWLASAVIGVFDLSANAARHFVVLPILILAVVSLSGTVVRRLARTSSPSAYVLGAAAGALVAPTQLLDMPPFSGSNAGLFVGITTYGLAAVAILIALYLLATLVRRRPTWGLMIFSGAAIAYLVPAHIALSVIVAAAAIGAAAIRLVLGARQPRLLGRVLPGAWRATVPVAVVLAAVTVAWGSATDHSLGRGGDPIAPPFNPTWIYLVVVTMAGGLALYSIVVEAIRSPVGRPAWWAYWGTMGAVAIGALLWGARVGEFTTFHGFFGAVAVFAGPVGATAVWSLWHGLRDRGRTLIATGLLAVFVVQITYGAAATLYRLQLFGANWYPPISSSILNEIADLPSDAKLAYVCGVKEEIGFGTPQLLSIDLHTGRRIIPVCFAAEKLSQMVGAAESDTHPSLYFAGSPQQELYPDVGSRPAEAEVERWLDGHGIDYLYIDAAHPPLLQGTDVVVSNGDVSIRRVP
jgi:hypothetical protein